MFKRLKDKLHKTHQENNNTEEMKPPTLSAERRTFSEPHMGGKERGKTNKEEGVKGFSRAMSFMRKKENKKTDIQTRSRATSVFVKEVNSKAIKKNPSEPISSNSNYENGAKSNFFLSENRSVSDKKEEIARESFITKIEHSKGGEGKYFVGLDDNDLGVLKKVAELGYFEENINYLLHLNVYLSNKMTGEELYQDLQNLNYDADESKANLVKCRNTQGLANHENGKQYFEEIGEHIFGIIISNLRTKTAYIKKAMDESQPTTQPK